MVPEPEISYVKGPIDADKIVLEEPQILQEIVIEELSIDGICGVY